jgi:hypothetical protein
MCFGFIQAWTKPAKQGTVMPKANTILIVDDHPVVHRPMGFWDYRAVLVVLAQVVWECVGANFQLSFLGKYTSG